MPYSVSPLRTLKQRRREEQREALHAHADRLGCGEVPELVKHDQQHEADERDDPIHGSQCGRRDRVFRRFGNRPCARLRRWHAR